MYDLSSRYIIQENMDQEYFDDFDDIDELENFEDIEDLEKVDHTEEGQEKKKRQPRREKKERITKFKPKKRKKAFSSQTALGLGCIAAALLIFFIIQPLMSGVIGNQIDIARVSATIYPGEKITEDKIKTVKVNSGSVPAGALIKSDEIIGKFTDSKIVEDDFFMSSKLKDTAFGDGIYMNGLDGSKHILSISIPEFSAGLSAKVKAGDIITIMATPVDGSLESESFPELQYIKVLAVTLPSGIDGTEGSDGTSQLPASITVLANTRQTEKLVALNATGRCHIILTYRGDEAIANEFLEKQDTYFSTGI